MESKEATLCHFETLLLVSVILDFVLGCLKKDLCTMLVCSPHAGHLVCHERKKEKLLTSQESVVSRPDNKPFDVLTT